MVSAAGVFSSSAKLADRQIQGAGITERQFGDRHAVAALFDNDGRRQQKRRVRAALKKDDEL